jgi:hypothetical protein
MSSIKRDPLWEAFEKAQIIDLLKKRSPGLSGTDLDLAVKDFKDKVFKFNQGSEKYLKPLLNLISERKIDDSLAIPVAISLYETINTLRTDLYSIILFIEFTHCSIKTVLEFIKDDKRAIEEVETLTSDLLSRTKEFIKKWDLKSL